jgi:DNA invertase Pin-like site-specific DNA recombinase
VSPRIADIPQILNWTLPLRREVNQVPAAIESLRVKGIGFRNLTEALDTTTAQGRLLFLICFGALAEFERSLIRERTRTALRTTIASVKKESPRQPWDGPRSRSLARQGAT